MKEILSQSRQKKHFQTWGAKSYIREGKILNVHQSGIKSSVKENIKSETLGDIYLWFVFISLYSLLIIILVLGTEPRAHAC